MTRDAGVLYPLLATVGLATAMLFVLCVVGFAADAATGGDDGAEMVLVPAGKFTMGSPGTALDEDAAEKPVHEVELAAFSIDKLEVTAAQYARFLNAVKRLTDEAGHDYLVRNTGLPLEQADGQWRPVKGAEKLPMVDVTWYGATAYAAWAGKRLPTEAEWERAARGTDGRKFPWGPNIDYARMRFGFDRLAAVGSYPTGASPTGCLDMAGNVWEWTSSLFKPYPYVATDGREDPASGERRVARGGSFTGEPHIAHAAYRFRPYPGFGHVYLGFRCARTAAQ